MILYRNDGRENERFGLKSKSSKEKRGDNNNTGKTKDPPAFYFIKIMKKSVWISQFHQFASKKLTYEL